MEIKTPAIEKIRLKLDEVRDLQFEGSPYQLQWKCDQILELIKEAMNSCADENTKRSYFEAVLALTHTMDKEVQYVFSTYEASKKKNAPAKRKRDYENELSKAISQIYLDLIIFTL